MTVKEKTYKSRYTSLTSDISRRFLTICIGVPILWMVWSHRITRFYFFQGVNVVMWWEWSTITGLALMSKIYFLVLSGVIVNIEDPDIFLLLLVLFAAVSPIFFQSVSPSTLLASTAGVLLISTPSRTWLIVSKNFHDTVSLLLTVWNADTGALIAGRIGTLMQTNLPKPKWLQRISTGKTVEGLLGGLLGGTTTFYLLPAFWSLIHSYDLAPLSDNSSFIWASASPTERLCIGFLLSVTAILGDLWESSLKRAFQAKDSGHLLPGHGGVLDRFDSSLLAVMLYKGLLDRAR